jgi:hypothetical protein
LFAPVVFDWKIRQLCAPVGSPMVSVQVALLSPPLDDCTIRHEFGAVAEPPVEGVHANWFALVALFVLAIWTTLLAVVQFQARPGHVGPA